MEILNTEKLVRKCVDNVTCEKIRKRLIVGQARVVSLIEKDFRKVFLQQQKCDFNKEFCVIMNRLLKFIIPKKLLLDPKAIKKGVSKLVNHF